jgi:hypothetical protein
MKTSTSIKTVLLVCPILLSFACAEKKKFGADVNAAAQATAADEAPSADASTSTPATPVVTPTTASPAVIPSNCSADKGDITKVTLLSTGVNFALSNQTLRYELSVVSCKDGSIVPIKDQVLSFDLNLTSLNGFKSISYAVLDSATSKSVSSGTLAAVQGSDLFGHTGEYAHWVTKSLSYATNLEKVILEINLKDIRLQSVNPSATTAESYLKVGDAAAVTQDLKILDQ